MKNVSKRLILLGAACLFALAMVAAPVHLNLESGTIDKAAAYAAPGQGGGTGAPGGGGGGDTGGGF